MLSVVGDDVVGAGSLSTFIDAVVGFVFRNFEGLGRLYFPGGSFQQAG
jgi:hypothetical protein